MKSTTRRFLCAFFCLSLLFLTACAKKTVSLTYSEGVYRNEKQGYALVYSQTGCIRAAQAFTEAPAAVIRNQTGRDVPLYEIPGMDPRCWLCDADHAVYLDENLTLPALSDLTVTEIAIANLNTLSQKTALARIEDPEKIANLLDIYFTGIPTAPDDLPAEVGNKFELFFISTEFPSLYYVLEYWSYTTEGGVIYDSMRDQCFAMGTVLERYFLEAQA